MSGRRLVSSSALPKLPTSTPRRRVVVTGLGLVTPLGCGVPIVWDRLLQGQSGLSKVNATTPNDAAAYAQLPCQVIAPVTRGTGVGELDTSDLLTNKKTQDAGFITFAMAAAREALADACWPPTKNSSEWDPTRSGVAMGSGIGASVDESAAAARIADASERGYRKISPYFIPRMLSNLAAGHVSIAHGLRGPNHACVTACASGAHSIGDAMRFIQRGDADIMVAGGTEAAISPISLAGFAKIKALSTKFTDEPSRSSRPFDQARDGFVMGEGAGVVVLEELEHARKRGAKIYAEVRGYGLSGDAHHITAPEHTGRGAIQCMRAALADAHLEPSMIDYVNAHATSTPMGDLIEGKAIFEVFNEPNTNNGSRKVAVSSTKGAVGHLLGAAGAVEAIFTILALKNGILPPTLNLESPEPELEECIDFVRSGPGKDEGGRKTRVRAALSNSFGFGGTNASLCFGEYEEPDKKD